MRSRIPATAAFILALGLTPGFAPVAHAQDDAAFLQRANDLYTGPDRTVPDARRSDLTLIPVLAKMAPPPEAVSTPLRAALATPDSQAWSEADAWASAGAQQAVLDAVRKVGEPLGPSRNFAFLLPYGAEGISDEARSAGLFVRVGEPPVLAAAEFEYLDALTNAACLVHVEATRLAENGKARDAATLVARWTLFTRQIANREFFAEKQWALRHAAAGLERLRDLVHEHPDAFTGQQIADLIASIDEDNLGTERLQLPRANLIAGEQIIARAFVERQGPSDAFGSTMAHASAGDRPLRLFGEASRWQDAAAKHGTTFETTDALRGVFRDWEYRWRLPEFDRGRKASSDYDRLSKDKFAAVELVAGGVQGMFDLRQRFRAEAEATRLALGVMGYKLDNGVFPRSLAGVRPRYVQSIGVDPFSETRQEFHYFVPVRDQPRGPRDLPKPHEVKLTLPQGVLPAAAVSNAQPQADDQQDAPEAPAPGTSRDASAPSKEQAAPDPGARPKANDPNAFTVGLGEDSFILYSAGADQRRDWAREVGQGAVDTLYWPPVLTLVRDQLAARGVDPASVELPALWITPSDAGPSPTPGR